MNGRGNRSRQLRQQRVNIVHRLNDVGARLAEDDDQDRRLTFLYRIERTARKPNHARVFNRILNIRDVVQPYCRAVFIRDHQRFVLISQLDLIVIRDRPCIDRVRDGALGTVGVCRPERCAHRIQTQSDFVQQIRIHFCTNGRPCRSADKYLSYAAHLGQLLGEH